MENRICISVGGAIDEATLTELVTGSRHDKFKRFMWFSSSPASKQTSVDDGGSPVKLCTAEFYLENTAGRIVAAMQNLLVGGVILNARMATKNESDALLAADENLQLMAAASPVVFSFSSEGSQQPLPSKLRLWLESRLLRPDESISGTHEFSVSVAPCFSAGTGCKVWDCSVVLAHLLASSPALVKGQLVIELGAGLGLPSIVAARCNPSEILATELVSELLQTLDYNLSANLNAEERSRVSVQRLDWMEILTNPSDCPWFQRASLVIVSDCVYDQNSAQGLAAACDSCVSRSGMIIAVLTRARLSYQTCADVVWTWTVALLQRLQVSTLLPFCPPIYTFCGVPPGHWILWIDRQTTDEPH